MLVSACVVPSAPLLLPALAPDAHMAPVRHRCVAAVRSVVASQPDRVVVVGGATAAVPTSHFGAVDGPQGTMPLGAALGDWLLTSAGWTSLRATFVVAEPGTATVDTDGSGTTALIVLADLSAAVSDASPRPRDEASVTMSNMIADAVASADTVTLATLDIDKAASLAIEGAPALGYLAAAAGAAHYDASVGFRGAPFGVDYVVTVWQCRP